MCGSGCIGSSIRGWMGTDEDPLVNFPSGFSDEQNLLNLDNEEVSEDV